MTTPFAKSHFRSHWLNRPKTISYSFRHSAKHWFVHTFVHGQICLGSTVSIGQFSFRLHVYIRPMAYLVHNRIFGQLSCRFKQILSAKSAFDIIRSTGQADFRLHENSRPLISSIPTGSSAKPLTRFHLANRPLLPSITNSFRPLPPNLILGYTRPVVASVTPKISANRILGVIARLDLLRYRLQ